MEKKYYPLTTVDKEKREFTVHTTIRFRARNNNNDRNINHYDLYDYHS